jgi:hypothetical protein
VHDLRPFLDAAPNITTLSVRGVRQDGPVARGLAPIGLRDCKPSIRLLFSLLEQCPGVESQTLYNYGDYFNGSWYDKSDVPDAARDCGRRCAVRAASRVPGP